MIWVRCQANAVKFVFADIPGLDALWNLLGVSAWTIELLEKILKETVLFSSESLLLDGLNPTIKTEPGAPPSSTTNLARRPDNAVGDPFGSGWYTRLTKNHILMATYSDPLETELKRAATSDTYYNLLHLIHPFPLECLINLTRHVARLRLWLAMITAKSDKAQMAKEMLLDIVDSSGINLEVVVKSLMEFRADVKSHSGVLHEVRPLAAIITNTSTTQTAHRTSLDVVLPL